MSRLTEIIENHESMDELCAILKHYSVNAQFVAESLLQTLEVSVQDQQENEESTEEGTTSAGRTDLLDDLTQYLARY